MRFAIDIGGTRTRIAGSDDGESFGAPIKFDTPKTFDAGMAAIVEGVKSVANGATVDAVCVGAPGTLTPDGKALFVAPNLGGWAKEPIVEHLAQALATKVMLQNDSALVALGEAHKGAGRGHGIVAYLTVSTGVGGARIVDGKIDRNRYGFEPGHQVIDMDGTVAPVLGIEAEDLVSGTATEIRFGKVAYKVDDPVVWEEMARWVAYLLNNTIVHWSPDVVVMGGSMIIGDPAIPLARIEKHVREVLTVYPELPEIKRAELSDMGGIHGGFQYLKSII